MALLTGVDVSPSVISAHRRGSRVWLIPDVGGRRAESADLQATATDPETGRRIVLSTVIHTHQWDPLEDTSFVRECSIESARLLDPGVLLEVRRPVSYQGMRSYIGRMGVPSRFEGRSVWFESRNEQDHLRHLIMSGPVQEMATQPLRFTWQFRTGLRTHTPDALVQRTDGSLVLVDVTRRDRLLDPDLAAVVTLTKRTAQLLGWTYLVLTEMTAQQARNISAVWACRGANGPQSTFVERCQGLPPSTQVLPAARVLGAGPPNVAAVWHLVAHRLLWVDLNYPLHGDSEVRKALEVVAR